METTTTDGGSGMITTQRELRREFWRRFGGVKGISKRKIKDYGGNGTMYNTDTRCAFVDWLDDLSKSGQVSDKLASNATL
jgi:hypothetical protein